MSVAIKAVGLALATLLVAGMSGVAPALAAGAGGAPGAPGVSGTWTSAMKQGVGTSYEAYLDGTYSDGAASGVVSKVWFSLADGIVTETAYGLIHDNQIRDLQFLVTGPGFFHEEKKDTAHSVGYLAVDDPGTRRPVAPAYRLLNSDKASPPRYAIEKHVITDPDRQSLVIRVVFRSFVDGVTPFILLNPYIGATYGDDVAYAFADGLFARNRADDRYLALKSTAPFVKTSAGFVGRSDGWQDLADNGVMDWEYDWADSGNVALTAALPTVDAGETLAFDLAVGFGRSHDQALAEAEGSLAAGYPTLLDNYLGRGSAVGWEDYLASLSDLPGLVGSTGDGGRLLYASALVLKSLEDKSNAGALIASGSIPWGDTVTADVPATGYRAVWPRDFYQCAMALLALGDRSTPVVAFDYLPKVQVLASPIEKDGLRIATERAGWESGRPGWFLQKTHVDGVYEWVAVQMDQTAMPVMLGWQLWRRGLLSDAQLAARYWANLKPAAEFLANGGTVDVRYPGGGGDRYGIEPPRTRQERWEEEEGYSPSTTAAIVAGLIAAADMARQVGGGEIGAAEHYESRADAIVAGLTGRMATTTGPLGDGRYYLRIDPDGDPDNGARYDIANCGSDPGCRRDEREVLDPGFLELVRYGVRRADDPAVQGSLAELDDTSLPEEQRVHYRFQVGTQTFDGWRRYSFDRYGERTDDGSNFRGDDPRNRGRVWPILTGERGHQALATAMLDGSFSAAEEAAVRAYVAAMEHFANDGLMLPEQVWDGVGSNATHGFTSGEGTNGATPLAWSHAEYVKLVRSLRDRQVWDRNGAVNARYAGSP